jgi:hypothetical protein
MTKKDNGESTQSPTSNSETSKPAKGFALTALFVGIAAFLFGFIPILGFLLGACAVTFGILAIVKSQPKPLSITGLALGAVGGITSLFVGLVVFMGGQAAITGFEEGVSSVQENSEQEATEAAPEEDVQSIEEVRQELVVEMEAMVLEAAIEFAAEGGFDGTPTEAICSPVAGGSLGEITETTTKFECFIVTGTKPNGTQTGVFYDVTKNWETGYITWQPRL